MINYRQCVLNFYWMLLKPPNMGTMYDDYVFLDETENFDDILVSYEQIQVRKKLFFYSYDQV